MKYLILLCAIIGIMGAKAQEPASTSTAVADQKTYLTNISDLAHTNWPKNRTINIVCFGHSVPSGYFATPEVHSLEAYPNLLRVGLAQKYPHAVINIIVTSIGGENSEQGARRFDRDVLDHHPDVVTIDYGINDRSLGLVKAKQAWESMIQKALAADVKVLLLTPTPILGLDFNNVDAPLNQQANQIRQLAAENHVGLVDSLAEFQKVVQSGTPLPSLMSHVVHPNAKGHEIVGQALLEWFP